jgi:hypothetical protein
MHKKMQKMPAYQAIKGEIGAGYAIHIEMDLVFWIRDLVIFLPLDPGWEKIRIRFKHPE